MLGAGVDDVPAALTVPAPTGRDGRQPNGSRGRDLAPRRSGAVCRTVQGTHVVRWHVAASAPAVGAPVRRLYQILKHELSLMARTLHHLIDGNDFGAQEGHGTAVGGLVPNAGNIKVPKVVSR